MVPHFSWWCTLAGERVPGLAHLLCLTGGWLGSPLQCPPFGPPWYLASFSVLLFSYVRTGFFTWWCQIHTRRLLGRLRKEGHSLWENPISNKQKKSYAIVTLAEAKPLEFPTTELTCATVTPPVPQGPFCTHVLGSLQILPSHPTYSCHPHLSQSWNFFQF